MNIAELQEAIAGALPEFECLIYGERRMTWAEVNDRTQRLAAYLRKQDFGIRKERADLTNWQSGQDHIALYMYNGNEYLESMLGAFKCRATTINVNYRYKEDELVYLLEDSESQGIIFHAQFAPMLDNLRSRLPNIRLWIQVDDGSGEGMLEGALDYEQVLADTAPAPMDTDASSDDLYMVYTGGTTGMPKGVLWRQHDMLFSLISQQPQDTSIEQFVQAARHKANQDVVGKSMPLAPMMHASGSCMAFGAWLRGDAVVLQKTADRFDAEEIVSTMEREKVNHATLIGDAFAQPLLKEMDHKSYDLSAMSFINSGGAVLSEHNKQRLQEHMPNLTLLDAVGSSEAGRQAVSIYTSGGTNKSLNFKMLENSCVVNYDCDRILRAPEKEPGWVAQGGHIAMGYLNDADKTRRTFPVIDGMRYAIPGDRARLDDNGGFQFLGRESITINSGGEKVFAEEVELAIKSLQGIEDTQVVGIPSREWGQKVVALVATHARADLDENSITAHCRDAISAYKVPKHVVFVEQISRGPNGKADYKWAKETALSQLGVAE